MLTRLKRSRPHEAAASPLDRFLSITLQQAELAGATAIAAPDANETQRALTASSRLKSSAGWLEVPLWLRIDGVLYPSPGLFPQAHFAFLALIQDRLLSLDASESSPRPMRFIEYDSDDPSQRRFAEVELLLDEDNTTRIEISRYLRLPKSVRAVPSVI